MLMNRLKSFFLNNTGLKHLSFFFALILWFYVNAKGIVETNYVIPLETRNLPSSLVIVGETVDYVEVRVVDAKAVIARVILGEEK